MSNKYKCRKYERYARGVNKHEAVDKFNCGRCIRFNNCEGPMIFYIKKGDGNNDE